LFPPCTMLVVKQRGAVVREKRMSYRDEKLSLLDQSLRARDAHCATLIQQRFRDIRALRPSVCPSYGRPPALSDSADLNGEALSSTTSHRRVKRSLWAAPMGAQQVLRKWRGCMETVEKVHEQLDVEEVRFARKKYLKVVVQPSFV